jgi:hypothetical protein
MAIYAYADETIFTINKDTNEQALGCGIFVTQNKIEPLIINEALKELSEDNEFDLDRDQRTINRNFFHSSEDSKNGHSYLCNSINKNIQGIFDYTYIDKISQVETTKKGFSEKMFNRCLSFSTLELFLTTDEIFLIVEKRDSLNLENLSKWQAQLYKLYEGATYNMPTYKTFYPKLHIELKSKGEPGLQVVDFLMWSINRTKTVKPNQVWHNRLNYKTWYEYKDEGNQNRAKYHLNTFPTSIDISENYPIKFEKFEEWEDFLNSYVIIERFLVTIDISDFTEKNIHHIPDFLKISKKLKDQNYNLNGNDLTEVGSIFLRLFDTLPLYSHIENDDKVAWTILLNSKYLASMLVRDDGLHFSRTKNEIHRWRYIMQSQNPTNFKELILG